MKASLDGAKAITTEALEWAKDKILMGAERRSAVISKETAKCTAFHEGGHAIVVRESLQLLLSAGSSFVFPALDVLNDLVSLTHCLATSHLTLVSANAEEPFLLGFFPWGGSPSPASVFFIVSYDR